MFRQSLRRCAGRVATSSFVGPRIAPTLRRSIVSAVARPIPSSRIAFLPSRAYSTESEAPTAADNAAEAESSDEFESLTELGVHPNLVRAIVNDMGYRTMTPVQAKTIRPSLQGTDIVAQAKTGTGKTLAFLLPLLQRMINEDPRLATRAAIGTARSTDIRGIILSPTRELAEQIAEEARRVCKFTGLVIQSAVGGTRKNDMLRQTQRQGCHLLVATPGRLNDILSDPASGIDAPNLAAMVLDEADRMLDVGFETELQEIVSNLPNPAEKVRQTMLVSATIPDNVIRLARDMVRPDDFQFVQTIGAEESLTHDRVKQMVVATNSFANVFPTLFELLDRETQRATEPGGRPFKAIVYFNTTAMVQLAGVFGQERRRSGNCKIPVVSINSKLTQPQREKAAKMFKALRSGIMFSSDVTARGMDFPDVSHVIQIDPPNDRETYIHRLGRTARQNKEGEGWLILSPQNVRHARSLLDGLPLQPDTSLESATADIKEGSTPSMVEMKEMGKWLHRDIVGQAYSSIFGGWKGDKISLVDDLNDWVTHGLGLETLPSFSEKWVHMMGLRNSSISVRQDGRFGRRDDGGNDRRGQAGDSFDSAFRGSVREDRGGGRSFGGDRGGGRSFGGDRGGRGFGGNRGGRDFGGGRGGRDFGGGRGRDGGGRSDF